MAGKTRPSLLKKTLKNVETSALSNTDKECIKKVFKAFSEMVRCKDCEYCDGQADLCGNIYCILHDGRFDKDGYCSYGKGEAVSDMARYIDADRLIERLKASPIFQDFNTDGYFIRDMVIDLVECQQIADVVPKPEI